ncbi:MAG: HIT domain-containing protein, partial [Parvularculaceae bacterium]|nr:HIT domain-containing protein [Parvularculaceae bacterium]
MTEFVLDPRLARDTSPVATLRLCEMRLMDDSRFPWVVLVPMRDAKREVFDLSVADRALLIEEIASTAAALQRATGADKINVGTLGNIVSQLHVHVVARF